MGIVYADITLRNTRNDALNPMTVHALVDSGAQWLCIPQHVANQLQLDTLEEREVTLADGKKFMAPFMGPLRLDFENRKTYAGAMVFGEEVLLGAVPMEDMDLVISPKLHKLMVNPESPNFACGVAMGFKAPDAIVIEKN